MKKINRIKISDDFTESRIESGPVEFQYPDNRVDWPGVFIRGDECLGFSINIANIINAIEKSNIKYSKYYCKILDDLKSTLEEAIV
jgi:hypothetical protein